MIRSRLAVRSYPLGLCETIAALADAVGITFENRSAWDDLLIHILRSAPVYRDAGRLDAWDEAYRHARGGLDHSTSIIELLDLIAELGTYNMYGAFDVTGTKVEYDRVVSALAGQGVRIPTVPAITGW